MVGGTIMAKIWQDKHRYLRPCFLFLLTLMIFQTIPVTALTPEGYFSGVKNIHVYQALGLLQGHVYLPFSDPGRIFDIAFVNGRYQCPFPPFPALLLLPFVWIFGESTRVVPLSLALTLLNVLVLTRLLQKLAVESRVIPWILAAFFLGSAYWAEVRGSVNGSSFSHIVAVSGILLALNEAFGKGRGILIGFFLGMAFLSRQLSIYSAILLTAAIYQNPRFSSMGQRIRSLLAFGSSFSVAVGVYLVFNWLRFGDPLDTGYSKWILTDPFMIERWKHFGSFHPQYFFHNFVYMFIQGFHLEFSPPMYLDKPRLDPFGTSLTFASPFVFFAFRARWTKFLLRAAWLSITLCVLHALFYFGNGYVQENSIRYALDFFPLLIILVALGIKNMQEKIWKAAIAYSIGLNLLALSLISHAYDLYIGVGRLGKEVLAYVTGA
jgi:hypothetical protein